VRLLLLMLLKRHTADIVVT
jgi:hypothetical protein